MLNRLETFYGRLLHAVHEFGSANPIQCEQLIAAIKVIGDQLSDKRVGLFDHLTEINFVIAHILVR